MIRRRRRRVPPSTVLGSEDSVADNVARRDDEGGRAGVSVRRDV